MAGMEKFNIACDGLREICKQIRATTDKMDQLVHFLESQQSQPSAVIVERPFP